MTVENRTRQTAIIWPLAEAEFFAFEQRTCSSDPANLAGLD
jgi:hypothetical protein